MSKKHRKSLEQELSRYSSMAKSSAVRKTGTLLGYGAASAALAIGSAAEASILFNTTGFSVSRGGSFNVAANASLDLDGDLQNDFSFSIDNFASYK